MSNDRIWEQVRAISNLFKDGKIDEGKALVTDNIKAHQFLKNIPRDAGVVSLLEFLNEKYQPDWSKYVNALTYTDQLNINNFIDFAQKNNIDLLKKDKEGFTLYEGLCERMFGYYVNIPETLKFINISSPELIKSESDKRLNKDHIIYKIVHCFNSSTSNDINSVFNMLDTFINKGYEGESAKKKIWNDIINNKSQFTVYLSKLPLEVVQNFLSDKKDLLSEEKTNQLYSHIVLSNCINSNPLSDEVYQLGMELIKNKKFDLDMKSFYFPKEYDLFNEVFKSYNKDFSVNTKKKELFLEIIKTNKISLDSLNGSENPHGTLFENMIFSSIYSCKKVAYLSAQSEMKDKLLENLEPNSDILKEEFLNRIKDITVMVKDFLSAGVEPNLSTTTLEKLTEKFHDAMNNKDQYHDQMPLRFMFRNSMNNDDTSQNYDKMTLSIAKDLQIPSELVAMVLKSLEKHKQLEEILPPFDEEKQKKIIEDFEALLNQSVNLNKIVDKKVKIKP